jgi:hypothetical protein
MIVGLGLHITPLVGQSVGVIERSPYYVSGADVSLYNRWGTVILKYGRFLEGPQPTEHTCFSIGMRYLSVYYGRRVGSLTPFFALVYGRTTMECSPTALSSMSGYGMSSIVSFNGNDSRTSFFGGGIGVALRLGNLGPFSLSLLSRVAYYPKVPIYAMRLYNAEDGLRGTIEHYEDRMNVVRAHLAVKVEETFRMEKVSPYGKDMGLFAGGMFSPVGSFKGGYFGVKAGKVILMNVFGNRNLPEKAYIGTAFALYHSRWVSLGGGVGRYHGWNSGEDVLLSIAGRKVLRWKPLEVGFMGGLLYFITERKVEPLINLHVGLFYGN